MTNLLLGATGVFVILITSELLWRKKILRGERARKLVHIAAGVYIALWPLFMGFIDIRNLALLMLLVVTFSRWFNIFKGIHSVKRQTIGDLLYPVSIAVVSFLTDSGWIFLVAIMHLAVADGFAAVIGDRYGKSNTYRVFGDRKSLVGSMTFLTSSILIMIVAVIFGPESFNALGILPLVMLAIATTFVEAISVKGIDDLFVPVFVGLVLAQLV